MSYWLEGIAQDFLYARRSLRRYALANIALVALLGIGIGATAAVLTLVERVLLAPLSAPRPEELVLLHRVNPAGSGSDDFPLPLVDALRRQSHSLSALAAFDYTRVDVRVGSSTEPASARLLSGTGFGMLGMRPALGRSLGADDDTPSGAGVAMLSFGYWQRRFGADPTIVGTAIDVGGVPITVAGVLPAGFTGLSVGSEPEDLWLPMQMHRVLALNDHQTVNLIGRLRAGTSVAGARAELTAAYRSARSAGIVSDSGTPGVDRSRIDVVPSPQGLGDLPHRLGMPIRLLLIVAVLLLVVVWINAAGLVVARARLRSRELVVKLAIGVPRHRLVQQLLIENGCVTALAAVLGGFLAWWGAPLLIRLLATSDTVPMMDPLPDARVVAVLVGIALVGALAFAIVQASVASRVNMAAELRGGRGPSQGRRVAQLGRQLVSAQLAVSLVLIVGGFLMADAVRRIATVNAGFDREHVLMFWTFAGRHGYTGSREQALYRELTARLASLPGVRAASLVRYRPGLPRGAGCRPNRDPARPADVFVNIAGPRYFATMGIPLLSGREFVWADGVDDARVVIISRSVAEALFAGRRAVGERLLIPGGSKEGATIVAVVGNVASFPMQPSLGVVPTCEVYIPIAQANAADLGQMNSVVGAGGDPLRLVPDARSVVATVDPDLSVVAPASGAAALHQFYARDEAIAWLALGISLVAMFVAGTGLYGTLSLSVSARSRELGIRAALGARATDAITLVMADVARMVSVGCIGGALAAWMTIDILRSVVFGLDSVRALPVVSAVTVLALVSLVAAYRPAARAVGVDPVVTLREE